ncbi:MAG: hypothetical protein PHO12_09655, partial [Bacteroidales bacterium]|nr:hypothetical protein [Bacteroidales bacterium]
KMYFQDDDAEQLMNLLFNIPDQPMPQLELMVDSVNTDKLKVLVMGDSYYTVLSHLGFGKYVFYDSEFWSYFSDVHKYDKKDLNDSYKGAVRDYEDIKAEIMKYKAIMIIVTEGTLYLTPRILFEELFIQFTKSFGVRQHKCLLENYKNEIKNNKEWYDTVVEKAKARGVSIEQAINDDAEYMVEEFLKNKI